MLDVFIFSITHKGNLLLHEITGCSSCDRINLPTPLVAGNIMSALDIWCNGFLYSDFGSGADDVVPCKAG